MTIFDYLKDVLFQKKGLYKDFTSESLDFSPYMLQRWCSMADNNASLILNETTNRWLSVFADKKQTYQLLLTVLPKIKQKKVAYIKKAAKSDKTEDQVYYESLELSEREIKESLEILKMLNL